MQASKLKKKTTAKKQTLASLIVVGYVTLHYLLLCDTAYFLCASNNKGEIVKTAWFLFLRVVKVNFSGQKFM